MTSGDTNGGGLARYLAAAALIRSADGGATVGLLLLALHLHLHDAAAAGGLLAAALSAPHLLGPWLAHRLDRARDGRRLLAGAYLLYGAALAAGALSLGHEPFVASIVLVAVAGSCGPLLTGGLSSRLGGTNRRAQGWDSLTYGVGGTAGPAVVAATAAATGPLTALLCLSTAAALAALLTATLPAGPSASDSLEPPSAGESTDPPPEGQAGHPSVKRPAGPPPGRVPGVRAGVGLLFTSAPLRRVTTLTMLNALALGALPVIAVVFGPQLSHRAGAAATLTVAFGVGNLAGSLLVTIVPLRGEADRLAIRFFAVLALVTAMTAFAPAYPLALVGFALIGAADAVAFTSTLAARSAYAPPGARAQVFVTSAGLKVALCSAGAAAAGAAASLGGTALLLVSAAVTSAAVVTAALDRTASPARPAGPCGASAPARARWTPLRARPRDAGQ